MRNRKTPGRLKVQRRGLSPARGRILSLSRMHYRRVIACTAMTGRVRASAANALLARAQSRSMAGKPALSIDTSPDKETV